MKAYSKDLRQKIIDAYSNQEGSQRQIAERFNVSLSFIQNLLKRYRSSGTVDPRPHGGGQSPKLNQEQMALLAQLAQKNPDVTLEQLCHKLERKTGVKISRATMGRLLRKMNLYSDRQTRKSSDIEENEPRTNVKNLNKAVLAAKKSSVINYLSTSPV